MIITLAMLWDNLNQTYPELETELYTDGPIRGIKLLPPAHEALSEATLYLGRRADRIELIYHGKRSPVSPEAQLSLEELFNALQDSYNRLRDWDMEMHLSLLEGCGAEKLLELEWPEEDHLLDHYLSQQTAELLPNEKVFVYGKSVLIFMQDDQRLDWVLERLTPFLKQKRGVCGVSRSFARLTDIRAAYGQTSAALRLGRRVTALHTLRRLGVEACRYDELIFHYQRYAPYHMVEGAADAGLYSPLLDKLIERDVREHSDNLRVLHGYLLCERRPTVAAAYLHMHRNNVIYRVGRIEEMLSISLEDVDIRRELEVSLLVLELIRTSYGPEG